MMEESTPPYLCRYHSQFAVSAVCNTGCTECNQANANGEIAAQRRITSSARNAPMQRARLLQETTLTLFFNSPQFIAAAAPIVAAPVTIRPIPNGCLRQRTQQSTDGEHCAAHNEHDCAYNHFHPDCRSAVPARAAPDAIIAAPAIISPIPSGIFAPLNTRIAPIAIDAPPRITIRLAIAP